MVRMVAMTVLLVAMAARAQAVDDTGFGGKPPLLPQDTLRHLLRPYDLVKLNVLGANYCENLLDMRLNVTSYTHQGADSPDSDAWHLQFPDDSARFLEAVAWEDQFSPVVRLETARRLTKGLLAAYVPGTATDYAFRHRSGGKTYLIFGDHQGKQGRVLLSMWGDEIAGSVKVGFRVWRGGQWVDISAFAHPEEPGDPLGAGTARSAAGGRHWNESPVILTRRYTNGASAVDFTGRYWMSDENRPVEYGFTGAGIEKMQVVVGEPGCPIPMLGDYRVPTTIHLPDRVTTFRSDRDGDRSFDHPGFRYLILRKPGAFGTPGYSTALMVLWDGQPERVEALADKGYGEVRVTYAGPVGKVWLQPYYSLDDRDMEAYHRAAESFLSGGTMPQNGFPTQQMLNAIPAGLAAGAYLLTRYNDPMAVTARIQAGRAVDRLFEAEGEGKKLVRVFFAVKAAAWMAKTAHELGDAQMAAKYAGFVAQAMGRMCSPELGYDGKGWPGGWDHFNAAKACWHAYDATGNPEYLRAFERALTVYTIDERGIYRYGKPLEAPGGFDTYSGSLPLAVWGNAGKLDWVRTLIDLNVPNGWHHPETPVKDTWNDAGAGPWSQDDANPEYVGISLRGAKIPQPRKYILPTGAFPIYDASGAVKVTGKPILRNPFFLAGQDKLRVVDAARIRGNGRVTSTVVTPGSVAERRSGVQLAGSVADGARTVTGADGALIYRFPTAGVAGIGLDLRVRGDGFRVEVSPDGKRWFERLDTWSPRAADVSTDISFLAGSRDELVKLAAIAPPEDAGRLTDAAGTTVERGNCRYVERGGAMVHRVDLPDATGCWLEMLVGNGYRVQVSGDGKTWRAGASAADAGNPSVHAGPEAAVIRMVDATDLLRPGAPLYVRVSDSGDAAEFGGRPAFLRRITVYGVLRSGVTWVRIANTSDRADRAFTLDRLTLRTWRR